MVYEDEIKKRREENRELLRSLGILNLREELQVKECSSSSKSRKRQPKKDPEPLTMCLRKVSKSHKMQLRNVSKSEQIPKASDPTIKSRQLLKKRQEVKPTYLRIKTEFGAIPGVPVGKVFATRTEASLTGIHRDKLSVIHGNQWAGCYSLILSGASLSVEDLGESFICTEEEGRNWNRKNSKMQLSKILSKNMKNNHPVRVLRGPYLKSKFASKWGRGYRYDGVMIDGDLKKFSESRVMRTIAIGLYKVISIGSSQSKVCRFHFERIGDQEPAPWLKDSFMSEVSVKTFSGKENVPKEDQQQNKNSDFRILEEEDIFEEESQT